MKEYIGASSSDPGSLQDAAEGRFTDIANQTQLDRADALCKLEKWGGKQIARWTTAHREGWDVVIAQATDRKVVSLTGNTISIPVYMVFMREYQGKRPGTCFKCEAAAKRKQPVGEHDCYIKRSRWYDYWEPKSYFVANDLDSAEETCREVINSWQATGEQEVEGWQKDESPWSPDLMDWYISQRPNMWNSLGTSEES